MFGIITLLFIVLSILIFHTNSSLNVIEFGTVILILYVILSYMFYINQITNEQFLQEGEGEKEIIEEEEEEEYEEDGKACEEEEEDEEDGKACEEEEADGYCLIPKKSMYAMCIDKGKGYVPSNVWEKISTLPQTMREKILKPLESTIPRTEDQKQSLKDENEGMVIDPYYVQEKDNLSNYVKLGVVIDKARAMETQDDLQNVNTERLADVSAQVDNINYLLHHLEKTKPRLYRRFLNKNMSSLRQEKKIRPKNKTCNV